MILAIIFGTVFSCITFITNSILINTLLLALYNRSLFHHPRKFILYYYLIVCFHYCALLDYFVVVLLEWCVKPLRRREEVRTASCANFASNTWPLKAITIIMAVERCITAAATPIFRSEVAAVELDDSSIIDFLTDFPSATFSFIL